MKKVILVFGLFIQTFFLLALTSCTKEKSAEVVVISTLHFFHENTDYYTYEHLQDLITSVSPDILALELTQEELD